MSNTKNYSIIYGFNSFDEIDKYLENDTVVILIEPRKEKIDSLKKKLTNKNFILINKALTKSNTMSNICLYKTSENITKWWLKNPNILLHTKEQIYTTSLTNIIREYNIQNIKQFDLNIYTDNIPDILENISIFNHIISYISINKYIYLMIEMNKVLSNFNLTEPNDNFINYEHINIDIQKPKICLYFFANKLSDNLDLFLTQFNIDIFDNDSYSKPKFYYEWLTDSLEKIIEHERSIDEKHDIILQFNPNYFNNKDMFQIVYPIKDNEIYLNRDLDIIYSTKNCMVMLYQIIKSKYFTDYLEEKRLEKPSLFKFFEKRYLYDYISKIFSIKQCN